MKPFIASILILSIVSFQLSEMLVYISFKINQDYIAKNLCVEKDMEDSTCKGCCQLKKKLEKQEQNKEALPLTKSGKLDINFCDYPADDLLVYSPNSTVLKTEPTRVYSFLLYAEVFRPPRAVRLL